MALIKYDHTIVTFQKLYAVDVMHSSRICGIFQVTDSGNVHYQNPARIIVLLIVELVHVGVAMCVIDVLRRPIRIGDLIHCRRMFFVTIAVKDREINLNGFSISLDIDKWLSVDF